MPGNAIEERLEEILATCMEEMFDKQGLKAQRIAGEHQPVSLRESLMAFCGFGSAAFRGSVTILGSSQLFTRIHPLPIDVNPRDITDWACELVNQTVGRFRNRLAAYDVNLAIGLPQSALAENIHLSSPLGAKRNPICFAIDGAVLEAWLDLTIRDGFELADKPSDERTTTIREGSVLFF
jgi:hypothetical protein